MDVRSAHRDAVMAPLETPGSIWKHSGESLGFCVLLNVKEKCALSEAPPLPVCHLFERLHYGKRREVQKEAEEKQMPRCEQRQKRSREAHSCLLLPGLFYAAVSLVCSRLC